MHGCLGAHKFLYPAVRHGKSLFYQLRPTVSPGIFKKVDSCDLSATDKHHSEPFLPLGFKLKASSSSNEAAFGCDLAFLFCISQWTFSVYLEFRLYDTRSLFSSPTYLGFCLPFTSRWASLSLN